MASNDETASIIEIASDEESLLSDGETSDQDMASNHDSAFDDGLPSDEETAINQDTSSDEGEPEPAPRSVASLELRQTLLKNIGGLPYSRTHLSLTEEQLVSWPRALKNVSEEEYVNPLRWPDLLALAGYDVLEQEYTMEVPEERFHRVLPSFQMEHARLIVTPLLFFNIQTTQNQIEKLLPQSVHDGYDDDDIKGMVRELSDVRHGLRNKMVNLTGIPIVIHFLKDPAFISDPLPPMNTRGQRIVYWHYCLEKSPLLLPWWLNKIVGDAMDVAWMYQDVECTDPARTQKLNAEQEKFQKCMQMRFFLLIDSIFVNLIDHGIQGVEHFAPTKARTTAVTNTIKDCTYEMPGLAHTPYITKWPIKGKLFGTPLNFD